MCADWLQQTAESERGFFYLSRRIPGRVFGAQDGQVPPPKRSAQWLDAQLADTRDALKHDRTTTVKRVAVAAPAWIVKRYNPRNLWHRIKRALRKTRAQRCWDMSFVFQRAGLNVAAPILMLERRVGPLRGDAYFVTENLDGDELLALLPRMDDSQRQLVKSAVEQTFEIMREHLISHGDMKATNLLWVDQRLFFIDLDAAQQHRSVLSWRRAHARDRRRFMKNWRHDPELLQLFCD